MISCQTRASGLLRLLSRARPMTAAGLVSETHMQLGSHNTIEHVRNVLFKSALTLYTWRLISFNDDNKKTPGVMMKICWIKGYFNKIIVVCDRVPISKHDMCSSWYLLAPLRMRSGANLILSQMSCGTVCCVLSQWHSNCDCGTVIPDSWLYGCQLL